MPVSQQSSRLSTKTAMSNPKPCLPPETLDSIIDFLRDKPWVLKACCLVSKSWIPHARKHLFANVKFRSSVDLEAWKRAFPDPEKSPAYHTRSLSVRCAESVTIVDAEGDGWIQTFSNVVRLELWNNAKIWQESKDSLVPFHNLSPVVKSLRVVSSNLSSSQIFNLVSSLPPLEDLSVVGRGIHTLDRNEVVSQPSISPPLTGTFYIRRWLKHVVRQLLDLPSGLNFREFTCEECLEEDLKWVTALVERCSDTLERVDIGCKIFGKSPPSSPFDRNRR